MAQVNCHMSNKKESALLAALWSSLEGSDNL